MLLACASGGGLRVALRAGTGGPAGLALLFPLAAAACWACLPLGGGAITGGGSAYGKWGGESGAIGASRGRA